LGPAAIVSLVELYVLPVLNRYLLYSPLHHLAALVDRAAVRALPRSLARGSPGQGGAWRELLESLRRDGQPAPLPRQGPLKPLFLGLLPTRNCNLACGYCGFRPSGNGPDMEPRLARTAIDWYMELVAAGTGTAQVHFFGGEPFCAPEVVEFAVQYAGLKAAQLGSTVSFEVSTNGTLDEERCRWVADTLDSVLLSLDGPPEIQDRQRAGPGGRGSFEAVVRSAHILSEGSAELSIRACVTAGNEERMPEIAAWFCREFRPASVCFEPVVPTPPAQAAGLFPPDPWAFARRFVEASAVLESFGVTPVHAAADVAAIRNSFCPVGRDAVILWPGGMLSACYLAPDEWQRRGLDLELGEIRDGRVSIRDQGVQAARQLNVWNKPLCQGCFLKWHCAGGCHVHHEQPRQRGAYGRLCIQARAIALFRLLRAMGQAAVADRLLADGKALARAVCQPADGIEDVAKGL
jgi:uncharacterized protein